MILPGFPDEIFSVLFIWLLSRNRNTFTNRQKSILNKAILDYISKICDLLDLPFKRYVAAIVITESYGDPDAMGSMGEIGLMQITQSTFNSLNKLYHFNFGFDELYAMANNIYVGCTLFKYNLKELNYDYFDAIKAYNVGLDLKPAEAAKKYLYKVLQNAK